MPITYPLITYFHFWLLSLVHLYHDDPNEAEEIQVHSPWLVGRGAIADEGNKWIVARQTY